MANDAGSQLKYPRRSLLVVALLVAMAAGSAYLAIEALDFLHPAQIYPTAVWSGLSVLLVAVAAREFTHGRRATPAMSGDTVPDEAAPPAKEERPTPPRRMATIGFVAIWVLYPLVLSMIGYVTATTLALTASVRLLMTVRVRWLLPICLVLSVSSFLFFRLTMHVLFPQAFIEEWLLDLWYSR